MSIRSGRLRSTIKWGGTVTTVLLLIVWVGNGPYSRGLGNGPVTFLGVSPGIFAIQWEKPFSLEQFANTQWQTLYDLTSFFWWFRWYSDAYFVMVWIPLWFLALLTAAPTFLIWRRDRKPLPNTCRKCGYSRSGLPADRACPECGAQS